MLREPCGTSHAVSSEPGDKNSYKLTPKIPQEPRTKVKVNDYMIIMTWPRVKIGRRPSSGQPGFRHVSIKSMCRTVMPPGPTEMQIPHDLHMRSKELRPY